MPYHPLRLEVSKEQKRELIFFMKSTRDKEEYRRAYAVKQKIEGLSYRTIAKDLNVNYCNVYDWINNYRRDGLDGIRNKRNNGGRRPVISTTKNRDDKRHCVEQITQNIWLFKKYMDYQTPGYLSYLTFRNECQSHADMEDSS